MLRFVLILAAALFVTRPAAASSILDVEGATLGCFGAGCSVFTSPATSSATYGLIFVGSSFDVVTSGAGSATNFVLGTIGRENVNVSSGTPALPFTLQVTFTMPTGIGGGQGGTFSALISGTSVGGGGPLDVIFDHAWQALTFSNSFGSGSFEFSVINDPTVNKNTISSPASLLGGIRNANFTPTAPPPVNATVPEPTTLILVGTGLAAAAYRRRQRIR